MKRPPLLLLATLSLAGTAWAQQPGPTHQLPPGAPPVAAGQIAITADEWQELQTARRAAIQAHPDLVAENAKLMEKMHALEAKLNAAMVKTNPAIAPLLTKFEAERQHSAAPASGMPPTAPPSGK